MATTAREIIYRALEDVGIVGVGQTPLAEDMNYGLARLNAMIGQFNRRRWSVFHTTDVFCTTTGSNTYTLGVGQQFDIPIVDKLEPGCFFRQYQGSGGGSPDYNADYSGDFGPLPSQITTLSTFIDYPLTIIESRSDWNMIALKNLGSWPAFIFYDYANTQLASVDPLPGDTTTYPSGWVFINPVPTAGQFEIHLNVKAPLGTLVGLSSTLLTPPEYEETFEFNLALRFAAKYQIEASKEVIGLARASMATIRSANNRTPLLDLPSGLMGNRGRYNIFSDRSY